MCRHFLIIVESSAGDENHSVLYLTFGHVETWEEEITITNSTLFVSGIADHTCNQVADELHVSHKLFSRNTRR